MKGKIARVLLDPKQSEGHLSVMCSSPVAAEEAMLGMLYGMPFTQDHMLCTVLSWLRRSLLWRQNIEKGNLCLWMSLNPLRPNATRFFFCWYRCFHFPRSNTHITSYLKCFLFHVVSSEIKKTIKCFNAHMEISWPEGQIQPTKQGNLAILK